MWESLQGKDFTVDDAVAVLLDSYDVDDSTARKDAEAWVATITENGLLMD